MPIDDLFTILDEEVDARIQYANIGFTLGKKLNLGGVAGSGGGIGAPPGGFAGQLAQRYVTYDTSEAATFEGNSSLVDNLNHIHARLVDLEENPPVGTFLDLTDTPDSYAGAANKYVQVNAAGNGLIFSTIIAASGVEAGDPLVVGTAPNQVTVGTLDTDITGVHINRDKYLDLYANTDGAHISWGADAPLKFITKHGEESSLLALINTDDTVALFSTIASGLPLIVYNSGIWSGVFFGAESPETHNKQYLAVGINNIAEGFLYNYQDTTIKIGTLDNYITVSGGNIYLAPLRTVDGVDISAHVTDSNPHATAFIDLIDAPLAYENPYDLVRVNTTADALEFIDAGAVDIKTTVLKVTNTAGVTLTRGMPVYINGYDTLENVPTVTLADSRSAEAASVIGLVKDEYIYNNATGFIVTAGTINDVTIGFYGPVGEKLWLGGTPGEIVNTPTGDFPVLIGIRSAYDYDSELSSIQLLLEHFPAFTALVDTPETFINAAQRYLRVNSAATAIEFTPIEAVDVAVDTSTFTRILSSGDTTVQTALNTLDQAVTGAINNISWYFDGRIVPLEAAAQYVVTKTTQLQDVYIYSPDPGVAGTTLSNIKLFRGGFDYGYILDSDLSLDYSESYTVNDNLNTTILESGDILTLDIIDTALAVNGLGVVISTKPEAEPATIRQSMISFTGELTTTSNPLKIYNCLGKTQTITKVLLAVSTPPTGADIIVNVYKNGNSIFASPDYYPRITVGNTTGAALLAAPWEANTYLTAAIIQTGSGNPGADLTVHLVHY